MSYLVDTCALSELVKAKPEKRVLQWFEAVPSEALFVSTLTLGEIRKGVEKLPVGKRRERIGIWLEIELPNWLEGRMLPVDAIVADEWGRLAARSPRTLPAIDALLAATALRHHLTIVTRNVSDFAESGVSLLNPWEIA